MKILASKEYGSEILKVMHKNFTAKFGDICKLGDFLTFSSEEDFNKFENHFGFTFGFTGNLENRYYFSTENKYIDIYYTDIGKYEVFVKGSRISGKEVYVSKLDKIFKSNGGRGFLQNGYLVNQFYGNYKTQIFQMLEGKFASNSKYDYYDRNVIDLDCGLRVTVNSHSSNYTNITYETL